MEPLDICRILVDHELELAVLNFGIGLKVKQYSKDIYHIKSVILFGMFTNYSEGKY